MDNPVLDLTFTATEAIPAFRFVRISGDREVDLCGSGERPDGISQEPTLVIGRSINVRLLGVSWIEAGATLAGGASVRSDANGRGATASGAGAYAGARCRLGVTLPATPLGTERASVVLTGPFTLPG